MIYAFIYEIIVKMVIIIIFFIFRLCSVVEF